MPKQDNKKIALKKTKIIKNKKKEKYEPDLKRVILEAISDKKGEDILVIDFKKINNSICDYFIICQGNSVRQVESIADSIEEKVRKTLGIKPTHSEGFENSQWILLDYFDIVVHVFQPETRNFYQLEALWADADLTKI
jgi:ribosome-associated protein